MAIVDWFWTDDVAEVRGVRVAGAQVSRCCKGVKNARPFQWDGADSGEGGWKYHYIGKAPCKAPARGGKKLTVPKGQKNRGNLTAENNKNWEMDFELCSRPSRTERNGGLLAGQWAVGGDGREE